MSSPASLESSQERDRPRALPRARSPLSPRSRNRGLSLRSSLFQRSIDRQETTESAIELDVVGSSSQQRTGRSLKRGVPNKKSLEATVSRILGSDDNGSDQARPSNGVQGMSALPNYESWFQKRAARNQALRKIKEYYHRARKFVLRIREMPPSEGGRHIDLDASRKSALTDERTRRSYVHNTIRSSRYTAYNFLPRQLFAQFSKLANFYFLCVSTLQMIPGFSTTGTYTTIVPLLFFVSVSMAKEGYDDLRRNRLDKVENNQEASVMHAYRPVPGAIVDDESLPSTIEGPVHWAATKWHKIQVGDVVRLQRDDPAPADMILLSSSGANGVAYVETMALDGETNLKNKQAAPSVARRCQTAERVAACNAHFVVEDPNLDLYNFEGKVTVAGETSPLTNNEIIYRGSVLRNTPEAVGMVIYTGEECKIRMNANKNPRIKAPALQSVVNRVVVALVAFVIALAIFNTVAYQVWSERREEKSWYLTNAGVAFVPILVSFIVMFNTLIPLSLYVSLEIVKLCQMALMNDVDMYDEVSNTPFEARTSTINEELGQVSYIFSDKTGTLTDNSMKFRKMSVAGTAWLHDEDLQSVSKTDKLFHEKRSRKGEGKRPMCKSRTSNSYDALRRGFSTDGAIDHNQRDGWEEAPRKSLSNWQSSARPAKSQPELSTRAMIRYMQCRPHTVFARKARMLLLSIALCHTCLPEERQDGSFDFQASSPDELALVRAAQELGFLLLNREAQTITLRTFPSGPEHEPTHDTYEILDVIEFSSKRKRMSVIVRFPDRRICILCKGADSIIMQRLKLAALANQKVVQIEERANRRKSIEAHEALRRKSEQVDRASPGRASFSRSSVSLGRPSIGGFGQTSMTAPRLPPIRDEVGTWLTERETEVDASPEDDSPYYSPRHSTQINTRKASAVSEARSSLHIDHEDIELVDESLAVDESSVIERCFQHINDFATEGLRTLLYAHRFLDEHEYLAWKKVYLDATTSLVNRQAMIEQAGELIEQDLDLGGATAIEDKLQDGVPEAIDKLRRANIKMWMLTGDKRETAINIGHSCRLIKDYSAVTVLDHETGRVEQSIAAAMVDINGGKIAHSVIVVDGQTLGLIEENGPLHALFLDLAILADSVVCCRASPSQKAGLVKAIRKRVKKSITLAIGDGANDIAMIQEAHVGIGITGKEGLQAARTSDYSIAQFRFLTKLLLVHGRWNYIRTCKYTVGTFWKEMLFYLTQALYQRLNGYTGTSLYESWSLSMFNTLFTSLPVIFLGIFEKDLLPSTLIAVPELYTKGQRNGGFNFTVYLAWMFMAAAEAIVVYFTMFGIYGKAIFTLDNGLYAMGDLTFTACVIIIATKLQLIEVRNKTVMAGIACFLSVGGWFLWNLILSSTYHKNVTYNVKHGFLDRFGRNPLWWLTLILIVVSCTFFDLGLQSLRVAFFPSDVDLFQSFEQDTALRKRFEEASVMELQAGRHHRHHPTAKQSSVDLTEAAKARARREGEVQNLLDRPRVMEEGRSHGKGAVFAEEQRVYIEQGEQHARMSTDVSEKLTRRFGSVRG
ncbi:drs2 neo1 protein [Elasticomyces elasticus]|nr:drs2 neo1 protein [Elasticomyces elasticus]